MVRVLDIYVENTECQIRHYCTSKTQRRKLQWGLIVACRWVFDIRFQGILPLRLQWIKNLLSKKCDVLHSQRQVSKAMVRSNTHQQGWERDRKVLVLLQWLYSPEMLHAGTHRVRLLTRCTCSCRWQILGQSLPMETRSSWKYKVC